MGLQSSALAAPLLVYDAASVDESHKSSVIGDISSHLKCEVVVLSSSNATESTLGNGSMVVFQGWNGSKELAGLVAAYRRMAPFVPILVIGSNNDYALRVAAFESGADNYLGATFSRNELISKVRRLTKLARYYGTRRPPISVSNFQIWPDSRVVLHQGRDIRLSRREFELLAFLAKEYPKPVRRETLEREVLCHSHDPGTNAIAVHMHRLRKKLDTNGAVLETVPGLGYRLK